MRIDGPNRKTAPSKAGAPRVKGGSGGFADLVGGAETAAPDSGTAVTAASGASALWAVQAVDPLVADSKRRRRQAVDLLDSLDELRLALVEGRLSASALVRLRDRLAALKGADADPRLAPVLAEIELRAAVELAKLERLG